MRLTSEPNENGRNAYVEVGDNETAVAGVVELGIESKFSVKPLTVTEEQAIELRDLLLEAFPLPEPIKPSGVTITCNICGFAVSETGPGFSIKAVIERSHAHDEKHKEDDK